MTETSEQLRTNVEAALDPEASDEARADLAELAARAERAKDRAVDLGRVTDALKAWQGYDEDVPSLELIARLIAGEKAAMDSMGTALHSIDRLEGEVDALRESLATEKRLAATKRAIDAVLKDEGWNSLSGPTQSAVYDTLPDERSRSDYEAFGG
jgi:hypothetical protein